MDRTEDRTDRTAMTEEMAVRETESGEPETQNFKFFQHRDCEFFPCHAGADPQSFNCLFCYCPLYALGERCGGRFVYLENGVKDCSACLLPHIRDVGYAHVMEKFPEIMALARK